MNALKQYLASIGARGGKATGASKRRGDAAYYRRISAKAAAARMAAGNNLAKKQKRGMTHGAKSPNDQAER